MSSVDQAGQSVVWIDVDRNHQIESQQSEVSEVVLSQAFAAQMRVQAAQSAEAIDGDADTFEVRKLDAPVISNHHIFDVTTAIDERADLSPRFVREFGQLAREFGCQYLVWRDPPGVELFDAANLIRLQAGGVSDYVLDGAGPPVTLLTTTCA
jgi:hypothetical protein